MAKIIERTIAKNNDQVIIEQRINKNTESINELKEEQKNITEVIESTLFGGDILGTLSS